MATPTPRQSRTSAPRSAAAALGMVALVTSHAVADSARLSVAEFGFTGPDELAVGSLRFAVPPPLPPPAGPGARELAFTLDDGSAAATFGVALQSGRILAAPVFSFVRTAPDPYRTLTVFDAAVREIATVAPDAPPGASAETTITFAFDRWEIVHSDVPPAGTVVTINAAEGTAALASVGSAAPAVAPIPGQSVPSGGLLEIPLAVSDADTPDSGIAVSVSHPASALLPPGSAVVSGAPPSPRLELAPPPGVAGSVPVTVSASDGGNVGHASFLLTVTGTAGSPTDITLANDTIPEGSPNGTVVATVSVTDPDPGDVHTLALEDSAGGLFAIAGSSLVVADATLLDFEAAASHAITISAADLAGNAFSKSFAIRLTDVAEGAFDAWRNARFSAAQLADPAVSGYRGDPDLDGRFNLDEYNGGSDPLDVASVPPPLILGRTMVGGTEHGTLTWRQVDPAVDPDLVVQPQVGDDLMTWRGGGVGFTIIATASAGPAHQDVTARTNAPIPPSGRQLFRIQLGYRQP